MVNQSFSSKFQSLYDLCSTTLSPSAIPPSSPAFHELTSLLDTIRPTDVGLNEESPDDGFSGLNQLSEEAQWGQPITWIDIYECESFTICIFCFSTSAAIPLHDHPGMTVFSKVLYGSLLVKAYDWVEPTHIHESIGSGSPLEKLAKLTVDKVLMAPCATSVLYPKSGGNLHCLTAVTPCAVLDILHLLTGKKREGNVLTTTITLIPLLLKCVGYLGITSLFELKPLQLQEVT